MSSIVTPYSPDLKGRWDSVVSGAQARVFQHYRDYMDYHADRFTDASCLVVSSSTKEAVFPASREADIVTSHAGLSYGGLLFGSDWRISEVVDAFDSVCTDYAASGVSRLIIKLVPRMYSERVCEEFKYAVFKAGGQVSAVQASTVIAPGMGNMSSRRARALRKARRLGFEVAAGTEYLSEYWEILRENLSSRHEVEPVHTVEEMGLLAARFPGNIRCLVALEQAKVVAGFVLYETETVTHLQYIASSHEGRKGGALELLAHEVISSAESQARVVDFGISTEQQGRVLNSGLIRFKEEFGGSAETYDVWTVDL